MIPRIFAENVLAVQNESISRTIRPQTHYDLLLFTRPPSYRGLSPASVILNILLRNP